MVIEIDNQTKNKESLFSNRGNLGGARNIRKNLMHITDLANQNESLILQAANLLLKGFREHWPNAWPVTTGECI